MDYFGKTPPLVNGFRLSGVACGIKADATKKDLALIVSDAPNTACAGVFTRNAFAAGPVLLGRKTLRASGGRGRLIVVNSGNANACTGAEGHQSALEMARLAVA